MRGLTRGFLVWLLAAYPLFVIDYVRGIHNATMGWGIVFALLIGVMTAVDWFAGRLDD